MVWSQSYDPLNNWVLSTLVAAVPTLVLLGALASGRVKAHWAALLGLAAALIVAVGVYGMPASMALSAALFGVAYGLFPIGWIILNVIFLYTLTNEKGYFSVASTATKWFGHEGQILRYVFWHSLVLASLVGGLVLLQAYVWPFTQLVW